MDRSEDPTMAALAGPPGAASDAPLSAQLEAALVAAQRGDPDAFRLLYRDTQPRLLRYLHALTGDDAEDIASETWLHIARDLHTFHGNHDAFRGWAATIARHRALDHLRRHTRRPPAIPVPAEDLAGLAAADDTASTAINATRAAAVLGKRPGAIRTAAHRGLRTLARHLDQTPRRRSDANAGVTQPENLALRDMR